MELEIGKAYLVEVWKLPPEVECNGSEITTEVMRFDGEYPGTGRRRTIMCGEIVYEMNENPVMQSWTPAPGSAFSPGQMIWKIVPIRVLEPDPLVEHDSFSRETAGEWG